MGSTIYREYTISFDPKPIPIRNFDFDVWHKGDDGPGDTRCGNAASVADCMIRIDEIIDEAEE